MITLENFVLEQEISQCDVYDIFIEQALSEIDVACALLDTYAKNQAIMEYCTERNIDAKVILEADGVDDEDGLSENIKKKGIGYKIGNAFKRVIDAVITCFKMIYAKITRVPMSKIKKKLSDMEEQIGNNHYDGMITVDADVSKNFKDLTHQMADIIPYLDEVFKDENYQADNKKMNEIINKLRFLDRFDHGNISHIKDVRKNIQNSSDSVTLTVDEFISEFIDPLEKSGIDGTLQGFIKSLQKGLRSSGNSFKTKTPENAGAWDSNVCKEACYYLGELSKICTFYYSEYSKYVNNIISGTYKAEKKIAKDSAKYEKKLQKDDKRQAKSDTKKIPRNADTLSDADDFYNDDTPSKKSKKENEDEE